jgi:pimeloyl-ACP methyl ester carboxylesterase
MPGTPLLLLHGALGNKALFSSLQQFLADSFDIHTLDFSGHGEEPLSEDEAFGIELFAKNVIDYLDKNKIEKTDIFGYSMGGYVALYLARLQPERINKIFTLGSKIFWTKEGAEKEVKMLDADKMLAKVPAFVEELQRRHTKTDWRKMLEKTADMMIGLGNNNVLSEEVLSSIQQLVCVGIGDKDTMAGVEESVRAYRALPNAQLEVFPATPHPLERVNAERLATSIKAFFAA